MANYQLKLTPVDSFFFGGEKHNEDLATNYFVESNLYPQQTTLLGLIRYYLLLKNPSVFNGKKITDHDKAATIIGAASFDFDADSNEFGKIKSISPLYFVNDENVAYFFAPFDKEFKMGEAYQLLRDEKVYNTKDHYHLVAPYLSSANGDFKELSEIIFTDNQVGNEKAEKGETRDNKFYKQSSKRMTKGWSFCFDAELEEGSGVYNKDEVYIPFGGEKSFFKLEFTAKEKSNFILSEKYVRKVPFAFCFSDCFIDNPIFDGCSFAVNKYVSFRNLKSKVKETLKYNRLSASDGTQMLRSNRFNLLQRGSVLYFPNNENLIKFKKQIEAVTGYSIGFNHLLIQQSN